MASIRKIKKHLKREIRRIEAYLKRNNIKPITMNLIRERIGAMAYLATLEVGLKQLRGETFTDAKFSLPNDIKEDVL